MLKRVFSSIFLILLRPPDTVLAFIFLVLLWPVENSMSPGRSGMEKRLPFFSWILGMWGPPFFFSCTTLLRSSLKTRGGGEKRREDLLLLEWIWVVHRAVGEIKICNFADQICWF